MEPDTPAIAKTAVRNNVCMNFSGPEIKCRPDQAISTLRAPVDSRSRNPEFHLSSEAPTAFRHRASNDARKRTYRSMRAIFPPLLRLDAGRLDDRPPLGNLFLVKCEQPLRRKLRGREDVLREINELLPDVRIGQRLHGSIVELGNDGLRRSLGCPQCMPER